jgi:hypothetical protein
LTKYRQSHIETSSPVTGAVHSRAFDITWRDAARRTAYDGDWKKQKLSETLYKERFAKDSAEYATLLQALLNALVPEEPSPRALLIAPLQRR